MGVWQWSHHHAQMKLRFHSQHHTLSQLQQLPRHCKHDHLLRTIMLRWLEPEEAFFTNEYQLLP